MRYPNLSISNRLTIGFGVMFLLILLEAIIFKSRYDRVDWLETERVETIAPAHELANELHTTVLRRAIAVRNFALTGEERYRIDGEAAGLAWHELLVRLERLHHAADPSTLASLRRLGDAYDGTSNEFIQNAIRHVAPESLEATEARLAQAREALLDRLSAFGEVQTKRDSLAINAIAEARAETRSAITFFSVVLLAVAMFIGWVTARSVQRPTQLLLDASRALHHGNFAPALALRPSRQFSQPPRNELLELAHSFGQTAAELQRREERLATQAALSSAMGEETEIEGIGRAALQHLVRFTKAELGAVFVKEDADSDLLTRAAAYGADGAVRSTRIGEGIVGQAALSREPIVVSDLPLDLPWKIGLGGEPVSPRSVAAIPLTLEHAPIGVLFLASVRELPVEAIDFAREAGTMLEVSLANALATRQVHRLAEELSRKNESLQAQSEEIQAQNEELQAQTEELHAQTEEIQAQNDELMAREGELQTQNRELERQRAELAELDRIKDEFLSIASHELRTPITTMKLFVTKVLRRAPQHPEWGEVVPSLQGIERQADRLSELVTRMLDTSRASMRRLEVKPGRFDFGEMIRAAVAAAQVKSNRHTIVARLSDGVTEVEWDRGYIEQVIVNLLENAIRYSPNGGDIELSIEASETRVAFSIRDQGIGIPEEEQPKLFQPYFRHRAAREVASEGLGIGLFLAREIVHAHGGKMHVKSVPGAGSTFTVELPRASSAVQRPLAVLA
jgi:signal transduction histidine kinase/HAMP domain-containing protein